MSKKFQGLMERRQFLIKASYLLGSVGITPMLRAEMLYDFTKKFLPDAHAVDDSPIHHFFDLTFRAGMPLMNIGTGVEFTQLNASTFSVSPTIPSASVKAGLDARPIYLSPKALALAPYASNLALTQGVQTSNGHTANFNKRNGGGGGMVTPIIEHTASNGGKFIVGGINWYGGGDVTNTLGSNPDLQVVRNEAAFASLFTQPVLRLSSQEVAAIGEASRKISSKQSELLSQRMKDASAAQASQSKGVDLLTQDYSKALAVSAAENSAFRVGMTNIGGRGWNDLGLAMVKSLKGMQYGLLGNAQVTVNTGDWHGFNSAGDNNAQALTAEHLAIILSATMEYLRKTPSITAPGKMMSEVTLIQIQSEFTRGINGIGSDFTDGGTDGTLLFGDMINGGYYGTFTLNEANKSAQVYGFDANSGVPVVGMRNNVKDVYNTVQALLGNKTMVSGGNVWKAWIKV